VHPALEATHVQRQLRPAVPVLVMMPLFSVVIFLLIAVRHGGVGRGGRRPGIGAGLTAPYEKPDSHQQDQGPSGEGDGGASP